MEKRDHDDVPTGQNVNAARIAKCSAGSLVKPIEFVLMKEAAAISKGRTSRGGSKTEVLRYHNPQMHVIITWLYHTGVLYAKSH